MSYVFQAVLRNSQHPEFGAATIPFPIPREEYDHVVELLRELDIGDPVKRDCHSDGIDSYYSILNRMVNLRQNLDELDYLAKRLDSFSVGEDAQFQAMLGKEVPRDREQAVAWLTKSAAQGNEYAQFFLDHMDQFRDPSVGMVLFQMLHHMSRIFEDNCKTDAMNRGLQIDRKRREELGEKKMAIGHRPDDHEEVAL